MPTQLLFMGGGERGGGEKKLFFGGGTEDPTHFPPLKLGRFGEKGGWVV